MNEDMNTPMSPEPIAAGVAGWFSIWMEAVTKPNEQTYAKIASSPNAKTSTAFLWVFISSLISFFVASLVQGAIMGQMMQEIGVEGFSGGGIGTTLIIAICGAPVGAIFSVLVFAIFTGVVQWVAKMFGGTGTFEQLAYVFAAITVPFTLVGAVLTLLGAIPYVGFCFGILSILVSLYVIVLEIMAVKGVNQFSWGAAIGSIFIPGLVIVFVCGCLVTFGSIGIMRLLGPKIGNTFSSINSSLP